MKSIFRGHRRKTLSKTTNYIPRLIEADGIWNTRLVHLISMGFFFFFFGIRLKQYSLENSIWEQHIVEDYLGIWKGSWEHDFGYISWEKSFSEGTCLGICTCCHWSFGYLHKEFGRYEINRVGRKGTKARKGRMQRITSLIMTLKNLIHTSQYNIKFTQKQTVSNKWSSESQINRNEIQITLWNLFVTRDMPPNSVRVVKLQAPTPFTTREPMQ
jgi:hypothetical protein